MRTVLVVFCLSVYIRARVLLLMIDQRTVETIIDWTIIFAQMNEMQCDGDEVRDAGAGGSILHTINIGYDHSVYQFAFRLSEEKMEAVNFSVMLKTGEINKINPSTFKENSNNCNEIANEKNDFLYWFPSTPPRFKLNGISYQFSNIILAAVFDSDEKKFMIASMPQKKLVVSPDRELLNDLPEFRLFWDINDFPSQMNKISQTENPVTLRVTSKDSVDFSTADFSLISTERQQEILSEENDWGSTFFHGVVVDDQNKIYFFISGKSSNEMYSIFIFLNDFYLMTKFFWGSSDYQMENSQFELVLPCAVSSSHWQEFQESQSITVRLYCKSDDRLAI